MEFSFHAPLWEWSGKGAWCFVTVPTEYYDDIRSLGLSNRPGFGSVRVECTVGQSTWKTSLFPDAKTKSYLLPVKRAVRMREGIAIGDELTVQLNIADL
jgi:Domain of unknown function (DUF1905)